MWRRVEFSGWSAVVVAWVIAACGVAATRADAQRDDFDGPALGAQWTWVNENPANWSLAARPGMLRIVAERGDIAGTLSWDARNILLQPTRNDADWVIETRLEVTPTADFQQGGLIAFDDVDNYVKIVRAHTRSGGGSVIEMVSEAAGVMTFSHVQVSETTISLRLVRSGSRYTGEYALDRAPGVWMPVDTLSNASVVAPDVGLIAMTGPFVNVPSVPVDFDRFHGSGAGYAGFSPHVVGTTTIGETVFVDVGAEPNAFYVMAASVGDRPGIPLGARRIPLNPDPLFWLSLQGLTGGVMNRFSGYLSARGEARAWMNIPNDPGLIGLAFHVAFVTLDPAQPFGIGTISEASRVVVVAT